MSKAGFLEATNKGIQALFSLPAVQYPGTRFSSSDDFACEFACIRTAGRLKFWRRYVVVWRRVGWW
jgi:hypothetical protein